ncbi:MAG: putative dithiol-disulfide isomerase involved in polyketide biosynthesis [Belnapia sp.]|nr:putative dithiol-disulfide isomerase involved in polyketide biosynthesis [Belnapia sp.]
MDHNTPTGAVCGPDGCDIPADGASDPAQSLPLAPAAATSRIDIVSDAICPWCWVGKRNLEAALAMLAAEGERFEIFWRPFQLNPDMPAAGVERAAYRAAKFGNETRGRELDAQVAAAGHAAGLAFRHDRMLRTPNTIDAHRLVRLAGEQGPARQDAVMEAVFQAYFHDGRDIGSQAVLAEIAGEAGLDAAAVAAYLASEAGADEVRAEDAGFRQGGLSGVPTFALDGHVLFSGAMPPGQIAAAFRRGLGILRERAKAA